MADKIIFLDVDGVLINRKVLMEKHTLAKLAALAGSSERFYDRADLDCVALINTLLEETGAKIVVSSCWRIGRTVEELQTLFTNWGITPGAVIDRTINDWDWVRGQEIQEWLDRHPDVTQFVIIDDDADMAHLLPRLVQTEFEPGLTAADAARAVQVLALQSI